MATVTRQTLQPTSVRQDRLMRLGRLAASAGLTVGQLELLAEARRTRAFAAAIGEDNAVFADWLARGAPADEAPDPEAALDRWQAAQTRPSRARG
jgi:hypothetical protein